MPGRALYWPEERALLIADPHFGKAAAFRAAGVGVPETAGADLERVDRLLRESGAAELFVLGDFLHARTGRSPAVLDTLRDWCGAHRQTRVTLVRGNHDLRASDPPRELCIRVLNGPVRLGSLWLAHRPEELSGEPGIVGHVHPAISLRDAGMQRVRLACFHITDGCITLPAFGSFTGNYVVKLEPGQMAIVEADGEMMAIAR